MAAAFSSSIDQLKQAFCNEYSHLSEQERQHLWLQQVAQLPTSPPQHTQAQHVPRSMSNAAASMSQLLVNSYGHMDRVQSAPAAPAMEQSMSLSHDHGLQRSASNMSTWQSSFDEQPNAYVFSDASVSRQQTLQPINETTLTNDAMVEYSPDDYVNFIESSDNAQMPLSQPPHHPQLQLTPNQWMPSLDVSTSPSTPSTALMTPVTLSSNSMSRQSSFNPHFVDEVPMLRSDSSMYPIISEDGSFSFTPDVSLVQKDISASTDTLPFLSSTGFTGMSSETSFLSPVAPVSAASVDALAQHQESEPCLVEDMQRSASASSVSTTESDASYASASSLNRSHTRHVRREREIIAASSCKIAPKAVPSASQTKSASPNAQMMRIQSEDGSSRHVGVISKAPYVRPQHPKILCPHCSERPEGFRGTHELDRHIARAHTAVRKGYICVAPTFDKNFLSGCKHCRNKKVYGAYYNAAAHLRRAHFHPRKRGRKGKNDEKRGGIGGGDDPPMDYLKQHWIREIEVDNSKSKSPKNGLASPTSSSESTPEQDVDIDTPYDMELAYPPLANDASMASIDQSPYVDFSPYNHMPLNEADAAAAAVAAGASMYNVPMMYATTQPQQHPTGEDFDFEAYRTQ